MWFVSELQKGALLQGGKYKIEKPLGQGGFGITYLAEQTNLGRKVCIKEFFMKEYGERTSTPSGEADATVLTSVTAVTSAAAEIMGRYREKFIKEAKTIARLDHPGIIRIHDVFEENGTAYYVMDFIEGENLNDLVKREGALPEERALGYIRQVADALSYVHDHRIMHLDVKPANILVRKSDDKAILIDFGAAKQYNSEGTQTSTTPLGFSPGYAPLEVMMPGGVQRFSPESDVYSLGATMYYLITGQNPPNANERMEMVMEGETLRFPESVSGVMAGIIEQTLQIRKKRPQTIAHFVALLPADAGASSKRSADTCPTCGEELPPNVRFCPNCGAAVIEKQCSNSTVDTEDADNHIQSSGHIFFYGSGIILSDDVFENMPGGHLLANTGSGESTYPPGLATEAVAPAPHPKRSRRGLWIALTSGAVALAVLLHLPRGESSGPDILTSPPPTDNTWAPTTGTINGHDWVDLGLSVKWATCNIGANSPEEYGDYFSWGETSAKNVYSWESYKYRVSGDNRVDVTFSRYNTQNDYGTVDNKTRLDLADDAARANWGRSWRIPTDAEWKELLAECKWTRTSQGGRNGYKVTGSTGNSIFLPAAGYWDGTYFGNADDYGYYWSSSLNSDWPSEAWSMDFYSVSVFFSDRCGGISVRPVSE